MLEQTEPMLDVFPGLRPFEPEETHLFFGRDGQSDEIIKRLSVHRFLAVIGTSGSGKSSLVRAGLLPSLRGGFMSGAGSSWLIALFRPGLNPVSSLAEALNASLMQGRGQFDSETQLILLETTLHRSSFGLVEAARQAALEPHENLLVVVDQFEEVFRLKNTRKSVSGDDDEAAAFVKLLLEAARQTEIPIYVVITMRSDFIGDCAEYRGLPEMLNDGQYLVPRMTREQRRQAIEGPIAVGRATITPRLVQRLLNDVGDDPDHLPILQHSLMRTWGAWRKLNATERQIDLPHYEGIGGMANALSQHADEAFGELDEAGQQIAHRMFKRLSEKGTDGREISRPSKLSEICAVTEADEAEVIAVIDKFRTDGRTFLMPSSRNLLVAHSLIDISHESLIRLWIRLRNWTQAEAESAALYRRLADVSARHAAGVASLWRDPELQLALDWQARNRPNEAWAARYGGDFVTAIHFLEFSRDEREHTRQIRRAIFVGSITLAIVFAVLGLFSLRELREARRLNNLALSRGLASQAELILNENPEQIQLAALLAVEGARRGGLVQANRALYDAMRLLPVTRLRFPLANNEKPTAVPGDLSADGRVLVRVSGGILQVMDTRKGSELLRLKDQDSVRVVGLSPDGQYLVVGKISNASVFNVGTGKKTWSRTTLDPIDVDLSANARYVALAFESRVEVYNLEDGSSALTLPLKNEPQTQLKPFSQSGLSLPGARQLSRSAERGYKAIAFSADGSLLAAAGGPNVDSAVYDLRTGTKAYELGGAGHIRAVAFSRSHGYLAATGDDVSLFDQASGIIQQRFGLDHLASRVAISPDARYLAAENEQSIQLLDVANSKRVAVLTASEPVNAMAFGPQGRNLLVETNSRLQVFDQLADKQFKFADPPIPGTTTLSPGGRYLALAFERSRNGAIYRRFDVGSGKELAPPLPVSSDFIGGLALSGDGRFLATLPNTFGAVPIFDITTGKPQADSLVPGAYAAISLSKDGLSIAVARDPNGKSRDAATEILIAKRMDPTFVHPLESAFPVKSLAFSPSAGYLAAGGKDSIALYDVSSHRKFLELHSTSDVKAVAATDDGHYAMAVGSRFTIYNFKNGDEVFSEAAADGGDQSMALTEEGQHTLVASNTQTDTTVAEFPGDLAKVIEDACSRLDRNLTQAEWSRYLGGEPYHKSCPHLR